MLFNKGFIVFAMSVLGLIVHIQARSTSFIQAGDVVIKFSNDDRICDKIECPPNGTRCVVSKSNAENPAVLVRKNTCYSDDNQVVFEKTFTSPTDPNNQINVHLTTGNNGVIYNGSINDDNFNQTAFEEHMKHMQANLHKSMNALKNQMAEMNNRLSNMFRY